MAEKDTIMSRMSATLPFPLLQIKLDFLCTLFSRYTEGGCRTKDLCGPFDIRLCLGIKEAKVTLWPDLVIEILKSMPEQVIGSRKGPSYVWTLTKTFHDEAQDGHGNPYFMYEAAGWDVNDFMD